MSSQINSYHQLGNLVYGITNGAPLKKDWYDYMFKQEFKLPSDLLKRVNAPIPPSMLRRHTCIYVPRLSYERLMKLVGDYITVETNHFVPVDLIAPACSFLETFRCFSKYYKWMRDDRPSSYFAHIPRINDHNPNWPNQDKLKQEYTKEITLKELILSEVLYTQLGYAPLIPFRGIVICFGTRIIRKNQVFHPVVMSLRKNIAQEENKIQVFWLEERTLRMQLSSREHFFPLKVNVKETS